MSDKDMTELRKSARMRDERRNERMTRGEILDAFDLVLYQLGTEGDSDHVNILKLLREAFE